MSAGRNEKLDSLKMDPARALGDYKTKGNHHSKKQTKNNVKEQQRSYAKFSILPKSWNVASLCCAAVT